MNEHPVRTLERMAAWADSPSESPSVAVVIGGQRYTPGFLLRQLSAAYRRAEENERKAAPRIVADNPYFEESL